MRPREFSPQSMTMARPPPSRMTLLVPRRHQRSTLPCCRLNAGRSGTTMRLGYPETQPHSIGGASRSIPIGFGQGLSSRERFDKLAKLIVAHLRKRIDSPRCEPLGEAENRWGLARRPLRRASPACIGQFPRHLTQAYPLPGSVFPLDHFGVRAHPIAHFSDHLRSQGSGVPVKGHMNLSSNRLQATFSCGVISNGRCA